MKKSTRNKVVIENKPVFSPSRIPFDLGNFFKPALVLLFFISIVGYFSTHYQIFSVLFLGIVALYFYFDVYPKSFEKNSLIPLAKEITLALFFAYLIWSTSQFLLNTSTPINVVTSCSMQPYLNRGDLILVSGGNINVPNYQFKGSLTNLEKSLSFQSTPCSLTDGSNVQFSYCTTALYFNGTVIQAVTNNSVVVYDSRLAGLGLIVHRAVAEFNNGTNSYFFTKGDNNPILDQQSFIGPINSNQIYGKVFAIIPYIGYLKLLLFLDLSNPAGCGTTVSVLG